MWELCTITAWIVFIFCVIFVLFSGKGRFGKRHIKTFYWLLIGIFFSSIILIFPIYMASLDGRFTAVESVLVAVHDALQLFSLNSDFYAVSDLSFFSVGIYYDLYHLLLSLLFVIAPIATFGFVLSFFKNISAYWKYLLRYSSNAYIFSELNEGAYLLGCDILRKEPKAAVVYMNAFSNDGGDRDFSAEAKNAGAICFKKDINEINFSVHKKCAGISFLINGENDDENCFRALNLVDVYGERKNTNIYVFARGDENEAILASLEKCAMKVRRIDLEQSFVYRYLYDRGFELFQNALLMENGMKKISVVLVGDGVYSEAFFKALPFFCQMSGFEFDLHIFSLDPLAEERFAFRCPELMDPDHNGVKIDGDAFYRISVHFVKAFDMKSFADALNGIDVITDVFVLHDEKDIIDADNIRIAMDIRTILERQGKSPCLHAAVNSAHNRNGLSDIRNFKGQSYRIDLIGTLDYLYSCNVIFSTELEQKALERHLEWGSEDVFWLGGYHYRSSVSSVLHHKMKILCGIPGADLPKEDRSEEERIALRILEHSRWNAYMRAEGYTYHETRNDLAKQHPCMVPFGALPEEEQMKDDD